MADIQLNSVALATESGGVVSVKTDNYQKADGTAMITSGVTQAGFALGVNAVDQRRGSLVYIASTSNNSGVATVDFHNCFSSTYNNYYLEGRMYPSTDNQTLAVQISDGGASFSEAGSNDHAGGRENKYTDNDTHSQTTAGIDVAHLIMGYAQDNNPTRDAHGWFPTLLKMWFWDCNRNDRRTTFKWWCYHRHGGAAEGSMFMDGYGHVKANNAATGVRFFYPSGNVGKHGIDIFGVVNGTDYTE